MLFQDLLYLVCSQPKNRSTMASIREWPEWILEILISNHEVIFSPMTNQKILHHEVVSTFFFFTVYFRIDYNV
jgi:hypothetical protein